MNLLPIAVVSGVVWLLTRKRRNPWPLFTQARNEVEGNDGRYFQADVSQLDTAIYRANDTLRNSADFRAWAKYANQSSTRLKAGSDVLRQDLIKADNVRLRFHDVQARWQVARTAGQAQTALKSMKKLAAKWFEYRDAFHDHAKAIIPASFY